MDLFYISYRQLFVNRVARYVKNSNTTILFFKFFFTNWWFASADLKNEQSDFFNKYKSIFFAYQYFFICFAPFLSQLKRTTTCFFNINNLRTFVFRKNKNFHEIKR